jgi:uncharacterized protein (DUF2267 family)
MATTGLDVFDRTVQTTNLWLNEIEQKLEQDRKVAWCLLIAILHAVRERLEPVLAADFGGKLPMLVRGAYFDGFRPSYRLVAGRSPDDFLEDIKTELNVASEIDLLEAVRVVCDVVARHIDKRGAEDMWRALPDGIRATPSSTASRDKRSSGSTSSTDPHEAGLSLDEMVWRAAQKRMYGLKPFDKPARVGSGVKKAPSHERKT